MDLPQTVICLGIDEDRIIGGSRLFGTITSIIEDIGLDADALLDLVLLILELVVEFLHRNILRNILCDIRRDERISFDIEATTSEGAKTNPSLLAVNRHQNEIVLRGIISIRLTTLLSFDHEFVKELNRSTFRKVGGCSVHLNVFEVGFTENYGTAAISLTPKLRDLFFVVIDHVLK